MSAGYYLPTSIRPFHSYLARQFAEALQPEEEVLAREAAEGAAFALMELGYRKAVPSELLTLLVARMFQSFGQSARAHTYLDRHVEQADLLPFYRGLVKARDFDLRVWELFDSRLVTTATWQSLHSQNIWVLDLQSLCQNAGLCYELAIFPALKGLLKEMNPLGDETRGGFFVGLRGYEPRPELPSARDILRFTRACLERQQEQHRWRSTPRACFLDLGL